MGKLTTHVLDLTSGRPAVGLALELFSVHDGAQRSLCRATTDADGRCGGPLLEGAAFQVGAYVLRFDVAEYFRAQGHSLPKPPFLDRVDLAFGIADAGGNYHVPLLVTPWSYSTYRGS